MAKAAIKMKKILFTSKLDLKLRDELVKRYIWSIALCVCVCVCVRARALFMPGALHIESLLLLLL